jgi:lysine/ornithine N-monooxygenase
MKDDNQQMSHEEYCRWVLQRLRTIGYGEQAQRDAIAEARRLGIS